MSWRSSAMGGGAEFDVVRAMLRGRARDDARVRFGPGDDAAVLDDGTVLSIDMAVENVHFRRSWLTHEEIGYRCATAALSDLAAMAAEPVALLAALALTDADTAHARALMDGIDAAAAAAGAAVVGGDVTRSPTMLVLDFAVTGRAGEPVPRDGARPGDAVWVTGTLGAAAAAVRAWQRGARPPDRARHAFAKPTARVHEARWLAGRCRPTALIDISDGLAGDAAHIAAASGVRVVIDAAAVPIADDADADLALSGGDDYELLFTAPADVVTACADAFAGEFNVRLTRVGLVEQGSGVAVRAVDGTISEFHNGGYRHFEGSQ